MMRACLIFCGISWVHSKVSTSGHLLKNKGPGRQAKHPASMSQKVSLVMRK